MLPCGGEAGVSTLQKILLAGVAVAVLSGGVAWSAIEASNARGPTLSAPVPAGPRLPGRFGGDGRLGQGSGRDVGPRGAAERPGRPGPLGDRRFLCALAHADLVLAAGGATHEVRLDRGTVSSVSSGTLILAEADGSSVTIGVDGDTKIRRDGQEASVSDLRNGDIVVAVRQGSGPARSVRAFDTDPCRPRLPGSFQPVPSPSPSSA